EYLNFAETKVMKEIEIFARSSVEQNSVMGFRKDRLLSSSRGQDSFHPPLPWKKSFQERNPSRKCYEI
ncbi:hypothetical protein AVEN_221517-1, partial [Araneus ventricosus]